MRTLLRRAGGVSPLIRGQRTEDRGQTSKGRRFLLCPLFSVLCPLIFWFFVVVALALPLFAHGCHGDDVDHEPLFIPFRLSGEDR